MGQNPYEAPMIAGDPARHRRRPGMAVAVRFARLPAVVLAFVCGMMAVTVTCQMLNVTPLGILEAAILIGSGAAAGALTSRVFQRVANWLDTP